MKKKTISNDRIINTAKIGAAANLSQGVSNPFLGTLKPALRAGFSFVQTEPDKKPDKSLSKKELVAAIVDRFMGAEKNILPYKPAKVYNGPNEQFVSFSYWSTSQSKYIRQKARMPITRNQPAEIKLKGLQFLCDELNKVIADRNKNFIYHESIVATGTGELVPSFVQCIKRVHQKSDIADSTKKTISSLLHTYQEFLKVHPAFELNTPSQISPALLKAYVDYLKLQGYVGKTINHYLWAIHVVSKLLVADRVLEKEIDTSALRVKHGKNETGRYRPLTDAEKEQIFSYWRDKDPGFLLYLLCIYYTCIRPGELLRLTAANFDIPGKKITVPWYTSKNGLSGHVQILSDLLRAFADHGVQTIDKKWYLFSRQFKPGRHQYAGKLASDKWRAGCRAIGIDDSANMYGLKHTFNVDYVERNKHNIDWEWLRRHNRHATVQQTQDYISGLTAYFLDETKAVILNYYTQE